MSEHQDNAASVIEYPKSRKFGVMEGFHGHDNPIFDTAKSRKISTASTHIEIGPVRKKSVMHKDLENTSAANGGRKHFDSCLIFYDI